MKTNKLIQFWSILLACLMSFGVGKVWGNTTVSSSSFSSLSGNIQSDANISYSTGNGDATTATAIDGTSIKLYRSTGTNAGGILLLTANNGVKIKSFTITFTGVLGYRSAANTTTAAKTSYTSLTSGTAVSNLDLSSVQIGNIATTKTQAFVSAISVTYATACDKSVTVSSGSSSTNGSISTITGSPVATCDASASNRTVTITVSPNTGYVAPTNLSFSVTSGNAVTATKQSGPTNNVYVYSFAQNDNNSTCEVNVACVGKQCTLIFDQNSGTGGQTSNLTATYGSAMPAISGVPTREHYDFEGYYDGAGGTGNKYYNSDGTSATNWNKNTTANTTLYAKWAEHSLTNYRTSCCTELATISGSFASSTSSSGTVTWAIPVDGSSRKKAAGVILHLYADNNNAQGAEIVGKVADYSSDNTTTSHTFTGLDASTKYWFTIEMKGTTAGGVEYCDAEEGAAVSFTTAAAACVGQFSLHTGNNGQGGWVSNQCFEDADWGSDDDAIYVGAFPLTNECYVGYAGGGSAHGTNWAVGGIKTYDIPTGRTLGWNGSDYYQDYPGGALGTFHIHKNSSDENFYLRFKPSSYVLRTGANSTWTSREMTVSATNAHYYETDPLTLTAALIDEHAYVDLKTSGGDGHVWCNFSSDVTAENNVKVKSGFGDEDAKFRATNLADGDAGKYGKFRIDVTKDVNNWKLAFVPMYKITYAAGTGASGSMDPSSYQEIGGTIAAAANGFTAPTYKQFAGWSGSDGNSYAAGANVTMNSDVTLTAQWEDIPVTALTLNKSSIATYVNASTQTLSVSAVTPATANPAVTWSSSDATVASVTAGGVVSFLKAGTATITARSTISTGITATCTVNVYSVTCVVNGDDDVALAGVGIPTLTFTPATRTLTTSETGNYVFKSMTQSGGAWATSPSTTTGTTTAVLSATPTGNVTVTATYWKPRTVTWNIGDDNSHTSEVKYNTQYGDISVGKPVLDTDFDDDALSACGSTKFIGWVKASGERTTDGGTVSQYTSNVPSASDAITANTNYYAMFAEADENGSTVWDRVTSVATITGGGTFIIGYEGTANSGVLVPLRNNDGTATTSAQGILYSGTTAGSSTTGTITMSSLGDGGGSYEVTIEGGTTSGTVSIKLGNGNYIGKPSSGNNVKLYATNTNAVTDMTPVIGANDVVDLKMASDSALRYNTGGSQRFVRYKTNTGAGVVLYKKSLPLINYRTGCSVTCSRPTPSAPASVTKTSATISWAAGSTGTPESYEYKVWEDGTDEPVSGTTTTGTSVNLTGLYSGVTYHWKVKADCGDVDGESIWATGTNFTTTAANLTYSVPTGATAVTTPATTAGDLNSAEVPTSCGSCWAFVGWTTAAYAENSSAPATLFPAGTKAKVSGDATLHAVYTKSTYRIVGGLSEIDADEYYVISFSQDGVTSAMANAVTNTYYVTEEEMPIKEDNTGAYIESPDEDAVWKFTGTTSAGRFQNVGNDKYLDLSDYDAPPIATSTSDYVNITVFNSSNKMFDIESNTTDGNYLQLYSKGWGVDDDHSGYYSCRLFKRAGSSYTTVPDCRTFTVTWDVNNGATTSTSNVMKCQGYLASLPDNPSNTTLSSCQTNGKFMGWSPTKVMPAQDVVPTGMFSEVEYSPEITQDTTFYAVFAEEHSGATGATDRTYTFTSASWGDDESAWSSGAAGNWNSSAVQVTKNKTGANATTISSYNAVTKVAVTYFTNASSGAGSIDIKVNGTSYTGSASVTNSGGTTPRTINFTPPSSALDGAVKITVTCTDNSIYIKSVQIFYTGSTTTYDQYRTACCNDPQLKFLDGEGDPTTEYVIVREDLASASAGVEIDCDIRSLNTTGAITWTSTHRDKNDYASAYTWSSSQPVNLNIDIANEKITAKETGVWQITISQAAGATTYCPEDATVTVRVKTIDKFIDAVNGNFSGEPQSLEDTGNGILLPTEAMFSTNNGCSTTRRLIGWIKSSDLATYASSRRVDMIDDLKTSDPATNKVIAPGTKVQATGVTWYAVWGVEK